MSELPDIDAGFAAIMAASHNPNPDRTLAVRFYIDPLEDEDASKKANRAVYKDVEWVEIRIPGDKDIRRRPATQEDKERFANVYLAFRARESQEKAEGTPLREWAPIKRSQAEELAVAGIRTVEHLAAAPDVMLQQLGPLMSLRQKARDWLEQAKDGAKLGELRSENEDLRRRLTTLEQMVKTQSDEIQAARRAGGVLTSSGPDPEVLAMKEQLAALAQIVKQVSVPETKTNGVEPKRRGRPPGSKNKPKTEV